VTGVLRSLVSMPVRLLEGYRELVLARAIQFHAGGVPRPTAARPTAATGGS
jgi:hypothetical protein